MLNTPEWVFKVSSMEKMVPNKTHNVHLMQINFNKDISI